MILALSFLYPICRAETLASGLQGYGEDERRSCLLKSPKGDGSPFNGLPPVRQWPETSRSGFSGDRIPDQMKQAKSK